MSRFVISVFTFISVFFYFATVTAKTTRDIGEEPVLEWQRIAKWISFYTNIERLENGRKPLRYDPVLEKAALWQAEYCAKIRNLSHNTSIAGMRSVDNRINHFGAKYRACGENLTVKFSANSEGIPYSIMRDEKGDYQNFGDYDLYWRDERQMGCSMVASWMKSPGHRENILRPFYTWLGAGAAKGVYSGMKSYYGCQVFGGDSDANKGDEFFNAEIIKSVQDGQEIYTISYKGEMAAGILEVNGDDKPVARSADREGNVWTFRKEPGAGRLVVVLYDKNLDIMYPVALLK